MNGLVVLIPVALLLGLAGLGGFFWALRSGQYEDLDGAAMRVLIDEESGPLPPESQSIPEHGEPKAPRTD